MMQELECVNRVNEDNNPTGGSVDGIGIKINWQDGPLMVDGKRKNQTGAFVEGVIQAALQRIQFYESSKFACEENEIAADHLLQALRILKIRTDKRKERAVEGTHQK